MGLKMVNVKLLEDTMQWVEDHPDKHIQTAFVADCGTAGCFAYWATALSGRLADALAPQTETARLIKIRDFATEELGVGEVDRETLFAASNTRPMLRHMVKDLVNEGELCPQLDYVTEVHGNREEWIRVLDAERRK
jgi:hypothetical protein